MEEWMAESGEGVVGPPVAPLSGGRGEEWAGALLMWRRGSGEVVAPSTS